MNDKKKLARREAISAFLDGMIDYVPVREISATLGVDITTLNRDLHEMEMYGLAEHTMIRNTKGSRLAWRLKDDGHPSA